VTTTMRSTNFAAAPKSAYKNAGDVDSGKSAQESCTTNGGCDVTMPWWTYPASLAALSVAVALLEAWRPWRPAQKQLRPALLSDVAHLVMNGHFLGVFLYAVAASLQPSFDAVFEAVGLSGLSSLRVAATWPLALQIVVALFVLDFLQWCVHNLLHRSRVLWEFHKVHHSVKTDEMDWIVAFRFHWLEIVVYQSLLYVPLLPFGFSGDALMVHAIFGTLIGHLNHANLDIGWGPLRYLLNSPRMHIWHHNRDTDKAVNFGIIFSCWDWLFRTASLPPGPPARLGYDGVEDMRENIIAHELFPFSGRGGLRGGHAIAAAVVFAVVVATPLLPWLLRRFG